MRRAFAESLRKQYREALSGRSGLADGARDFSFKQLHKSVQTEFQEIKDGIPILVCSIWGNHARAVVAMQRHATVSRRLVKQWQDAEQRLIAVANSLTSLHTGQKLVAVGAPLAAAHLLQSGTSTAHCYTSPSIISARGGLFLPVTHTSLTLKAINDLVSRLAEEISLLQRGLFLFFLFLPMVVTAPVLLITDRHREAWLKLMLWTVERAGPAFIKWGQWAATRPDLFAPDVTAALQQLQTNAPTHAFKHTRSIIESAFNRPLEEIFLEFEETPVASGSIAQVHKAVLSPVGAHLAQREAIRGGLFSLPARTRRREAATFSDGAVVAVKVRHPGVTGQMEKDFNLLRRAASIAEVIPGGVGPQFKESLMQFGAPMREQLDLRAEAAALSRFAENFKWWNGVRFPLPAAPSLVASDVLVESFEEGEHISKYIGKEGPHNKRLANLGMSCYMKMLLVDNLIHADLHQGNILVSIEKAASPGSLFSKLGAAVGWDPTLPRLVLLDVGMTARLTGDDQQNLIGFFSSLAAMDGGAIAESVLKFAEKEAPDPGRFRSDMATLFDKLDADYMRENSQQVIGWMMDTIRHHQVHLQGVVSTVVFSSMVLEGWSSKLNPDIRIIESLKGVLPAARKAAREAAVDTMIGNQSKMVTLA